LVHSGYTVYSYSGDGFDPSFLLVKEA